MAIREPMTPAEADAAWRRFEGRNPDAHLTSGRRTPERNREAGGSDDSKHLIGMARDYGLPSVERRDEALADATRLGFWCKPYEWGIHTQALPPGPVPTWWTAKYGGFNDGR